MQSYIHRFEPLWGIWQVGPLLGEGSYGKVWQGECRTQDGIRLAAIKEIVVPSSPGNLSAARAEGLDVEGAKLYFQEVMKDTLDEIHLMQKLSDCEHIVRFDDFEIHTLDREGEFGFVILIRMEKLEPLKNRLLEEGLTLRDTIRLGIHICRALEVCAEKGIVHRDIKPDNLFYCPQTDTYKLGDFGIAHELARPTEGKGRAGTLSHMSPEVYAGAPFTEAADLYALGMILYRLLNDNRVPLLPYYPAPFTPKQRNHALVERLRGKEPGLPHMAITENPAAADAEAPDSIGTNPDCVSASTAILLGMTVQKAISACPEKRFPSAAALREALEAFVQEQE